MNYDISIYRTIYVPYENAVNVPDVFDVSVGSSFGYSEPNPQPNYNSPSLPNLSSYDNPISSFDAPIYDENSYTAAAVSFIIVFEALNNSIFIYYRALMMPIHSVTPCIVKMLVPWFERFENQL